jgi:hypothetical protein
VRGQSSSRLAVRCLGTGRSSNHGRSRFAVERPVNGRVRALRAHRSPLTGVPSQSLPGAEPTRSLIWRDKGSAVGVPEWGCLPVPRASSSRAVRGRSSDGLGTQCMSALVVLSCDRAAASGSSSRKSGEPAWPHCAAARGPTRAGSRLVMSLAASRPPSASHCAEGPPGPSVGRFTISSFSCTECRVVDEHARFQHGVAATGESRTARPWWTAHP